jgi:acetyl esterase/lipase
MRTNRSFPILVSIGAAIAWLPICSCDASAADKNVPDDVILQREIRYCPGSNPKWTLDLARPRMKAAHPRPAILVIHGGGWIEGDKSSFSTPEHPVPGNVIDFAHLGFVAATMNYRLAGEAPFPAALHDCQCAVRWMRAHAREYDIDPDQIGAYGNSAGGHLALLLAMANQPADLQTDATWPEFSSRVQAAASDSGPIDLVYQHEHEHLRVVVTKFLGGPPEGARQAEYERASPSNRITKTVPPLMLIYGTLDTQVPVETADRFVLALHEAGVKDVSYHRLAGVDHCPHSIQRIAWLQPAVNEFFQRTLSRAAQK